MGKVRLGPEMKCVENYVNSIWIERIQLYPIGRQYWRGENRLHWY